MKRTYDSHYDAIVVGFGLAGALFAWHWVRHHGKTVLCLDAKRPMNSSRAAAGILNPVTGKRLVKSWNVDAFLPAARQSYREIESELDFMCFHEKTIRRIYQSEEECKRWDKRNRQAHYQTFLGRRFPANQLPESILDPLGSFEIRGVGNLDTDRFLDAMEEWATDQGLLIPEALDYSQLEIGNQMVRWKDFTADRVIFCEGYRTLDNPWFSWLPFNPAKGEILTFSGIELPEQEILSKQKWLLPLSGHRFISGSTWSWDALNEQPTPQGKSALLQGLSKMISRTDQLKIEAHRAGVRPCTRDRFPFLGQHPEHSPLYVFNGFGSKGALMIPLLAREFAAFVSDGMPFHPDANIKRVIDHFPGGRH